MYPFKKNFKYYFLAALLVVAVFVWYAVLAESRDGLTVAFLDVGQGDATLIEKDGNQILIDGGRNKKVLQELSKVMPFYDRSIDLVIATHPDADHIGGLSDILENFNIGLIMETGVGSDTAVYAEFERQLEEKNLKKILARRGMKIMLGKDAYLLILFPNIDVTGFDTNEASIVAKLVYGSTSFLLTADSPKNIEQYLAALSPNSVDVDVLKVGHHGSRTSTSEQLAGYASPLYAVISVGKDNNYGHPHKEVIDTLNKFSIPILRTDEMGTIKFKSDGEKIFIDNKR